MNYPGDYQVKHTGGVPPRHKALLAGEIDAGMQSVPWNYVAEGCRSACRRYLRSSLRYNTIGFRVVLAPRSDS